MDPLGFHFKHSTTIKFSCQTRCGKTGLARNILQEQLINPLATRIIRVYSELQLDYDMISVRYFGVEFEKGWRDEIVDSLN